MKIAILGGSFNPLHIGHAFLADSMICDYGYDKVLFVPTCIPPHKEIASGISTEHRLGLVKAFCSSVSGGVFELDPCEVERGGISYTVDTLEYITNKYKNELTEKPALLMGQEIAAEFHKWKNPEKVAALAKITIVPRFADYSVKDVEKSKNKPTGAYAGDFSTEFDIEKFGYECNMIDVKSLPISSTNIRNRISNNLSFQYLVPQSVFEYILKNNLYK